MQGALVRSPSPDRPSTSIHTVVTSLPSQHFTAVACHTGSSLDHSSAVSSVSDLSSREVIMPQAVLPDQILEPHIDDMPPELSPTVQSVVSAESSAVVAVAMAALPTSGALDHSVVHSSMNCVVERTGNIVWKMPWYWCWQRAKFRSPIELSREFVVFATSLDLRQANKQANKQTTKQIRPRGGIAKYGQGPAINVAGGRGEMFLPQRFDSLPGF